MVSLRNVTKPRGFIYEGREVRRTIAKRTGTLNRQIGKKGSFGRSILDVKEEGTRLVVLHATKGYRNYSAARIDKVLPGPRS